MVESKAVVSLYQDVQEFRYNFFKEKRRPVESIKPVEQIDNKKNSPKPMNKNDANSKDSGNLSKSNVDIKNKIYNIIMNLFKKAYFIKVADFISLFKNEKNIFFDNKDLLHNLSLVADVLESNPAFKVERIEKIQWVYLKSNINVFADDDELKSVIKNICMMTRDNSVVSVSTLDIMCKKLFGNLVYKKFNTQSYSELQERYVYLFKSFSNLQNKNNLKFFEVDGIRSNNNSGNNNSGNNNNHKKENSSNNVINIKSKSSSLSNGSNMTFSSNSNKSYSLYLITIIEYEMFVNSFICREVKTLNPEYLDGVFNGKVLMQRIKTINDELLAFNKVYYKNKRDPGLYEIVERIQQSNVGFPIDSVIAINKIYINLLFRLALRGDINACCRIINLPNMNMLTNQLFENNLYLKSKTVITMDIFKELVERFQNEVASSYDEKQIPNVFLSIIQSLIIESNTEPVYRKRKYDDI